MVERLNGIQEVIGSIPTISTKKRERFCRSRFSVDRYKGDKRPERSHPFYLRQQILARKNALRLRGQTISTRKRERFCRLRFTMDRYIGNFIHTDFYVIFYAQKYVIFRTAYI